MHTSRSFVAGAVGGIVGAALLMLVLFLLGVTDVKKETTVTVTAPAAFASPGATSAARALTPTQIYDREATGVVEITSTFPSTGGGLLGPAVGSNVGIGSGFVVDKQGHILTNAHVVSDAGQRATKVTVAFKGNGSQTRSVTGKIVGVDTQSDVAVIKVDPSGLTLNPLPMGDSNVVQVGEPVVAIGNPLALEFTLTSGIVSAIHRDLSPQAGTNILERHPDRRRHQPRQLGRTVDRRRRQRHRHQREYRVHHRRQPGTRLRRAHRHRQELARADR